MAKSIQFGQDQCGSCPPTPVPVEPTNQVCVQPGSHIIQAPCAVGSTPQQSSQVGANPVWPGGDNPSDGCRVFSNPAVLQSFSVPSIGKTGSMYAECADTWALPGMLMYFPNYGQLEVSGVSGQVVTFRNLSIETGTEIREGLRFGIGIPRPPITTESDGGDSVVDDGGDEIVNGTQLSSVYGEENGTRKRLVPVNGTALVASNGKWQRIALGMRSHPITEQNILSFNGNARDKVWTVNLPSLPTLPDYVTQFGVELYASVGSIRAGQETTSCAVTLKINDKSVLYTASEHRKKVTAIEHTAYLAKDATTIKLETVHQPNNPGTMILEVDVRAYRF